ncbi:hypothetical protein AHAS_Ahas07G0092000 [Arachis hypogaea]
MCPTSVQHARCVLVSAVLVSASCAAHKLRVDLSHPRVASQETGPSPGIVAINAYRNLLRCKVDPPEAWYPTVEEALRTTRFYQLSRVGVMRGHSAMLIALVERWRPETHTFIMPVGEVTVTLEDVLHLFGLPIDKRRGSVCRGLRPFPEPSLHRLRYRWHTDGVIIHDPENGWLGLRLPLGTRSTLWKREYSIMTGTEFMTNGYNNGVTAATVIYEIEVYSQLSTSPCLQIIGIGTLDHTGCT